jgi:Lon protease-like protein
MASLHSNLAQRIPAVIPVFPLSSALLLPRGQMPLNIFEPRYLAMVDYALGHERMIGNGAAKIRA